MQKNLKPKFTFSQDKPVKITVTVSQSTQEIINNYIDFYYETTSEKITPDLLIAQALPDALLSDKSFIKWRKNKQKIMLNWKKICSNSIKFLLSFQQQFLFFCNASVKSGELIFKRV